MSWEVVIGLEVHAQLATKSKIFSGASTAFGAQPNTQACLVDLGYPGVLPVLNEQAVAMAVKFGLAVGAEITRRSVFARKNYFYPDLPKGYQISQFELPIVGKGQLTIKLEDDTEKVVGITRAHLEEDAGKSLHENFSDRTGIDLNRAGTPLLEIVSEPDMRSATEAVAYMRKIHQIVRYLGVCDGNMQEGSFRCDANVSVRPMGQEELGTRTELKNINSFRFVERAINFEIQRQIDLIEDGGTVTQETRLYDPDKDETRSMRSKEEANDYRYFPDPDLLPVVIDDDFIAAIKAELPELPEARATRFAESFGLKSAQIETLVGDVDTAAYFEQVVGEGADPRLAANYVLGDLTGALNKDSLEIAVSKVSAVDMAGLIKRVMDNTISGKIAKEVFEAMWNGEGGADAVIESKGLKQITDIGAIEVAVDQVIADNPQQVAEFKGGKEKVLGFFVGKVMQLTQGKANPGQVNKLLRDKLSS
ncbi:MAG: Asp-tRNA(Asn)/Glu-tRNA(Gln) amidotransferase subunit GatB [Chromatiales bacterium]|jgi:aspartyl-tRNA(Asn)/glutamyl-tRNA(Gln) amidotransferase subunit B|nr:Asp-tRNA(Asn)/Glu-tRNA(Gln) amidotransferase subunit GatB [Chromatiales bacterium]